MNPELRRFIVRDAALVLAILAACVVVIGLMGRP